MSYRQALADPELAPEQREVFVIGRAMRALLDAIMPHLERTAEKLSRGESDLTEDLLQEASIVLWEMDPSRYDLADWPLIRAAMYRRMRDVARRERWRSVSRSRGALRDVLDSCGSQADLGLDSAQCTWGEPQPGDG